MYCMPQVGTKVSLYFPGVDEREAIVVNCFRTNGDSCEKMKDPSKRAFATEHNKELTLYPKEIGISSGSGSSILISDEKGIDFNSKKSIRIIGSEINFSAPIINIKASIGVINFFKIDGNNELIRSSFTMSNEFNLMAEGGTTLVGREFTEYKAFDDEPERGSFWGGLVKNVLGGLAVVGAVCVTLATLGVGGAVILGAAIGGATAVGMMALSDVRRGELGSEGSYLFAGLSGAVTGAISNGIFKWNLSGKIKSALSIANDFLTDVVEDISYQINDGKKLKEINFFGAISSSLLGMGTGLGISQLMKFKQFRVAFEMFNEINDMINNPLSIFKKNRNLFKDTLGVKNGSKNKSSENNNGKPKKPILIKKIDIGGFKFDIFGKENGEKIKNLIKQLNKNPTIQRAGNFVEMLTDMTFEGNGNERVGNNRVTNLDDPTYNGIDGIYRIKIPGEQDRYVIVESKYNNSKLNKTKKSGLQISYKWLTAKVMGKKGNEQSRIEKYFENDEAGYEKFKEAFESGRVDKVLTEIKPDGQIFNYILDNDGKKIPKPEYKDIVKKRGKKKPPKEELYQQYTIPKSNGGKKK